MKYPCEFGQWHTDNLRRRHLLELRQRIENLKLILGSEYEWIKREFRILDNTMHSISKSLSADNSKMTRCRIDEALEDHVDL